MKILSVSTLLLLFSSIILQAESASAIINTDTTKGITQELEHFTQAATVTKVNEPYQPYIITVLEGEKLEKLGVSTLGEALELFPGVDMSTDLSDIKTPIFRGSNPFAFGQVKLLIDGMLANDTSIDGFASYLYMPVEIIKRIEVVRGPGGRTDGINAYAGSIHVITYAEEIGEPVNRVFAKTGSHDLRVGGFSSSFSEGKLHVHTDGYYHKDNKTLFTGPDAATFLGNSSFTQSGDAPLQTTSYALGLQLDYDDFNLKVRGTQFIHGSAYGLNGLLPQDDDRIEIPSYLLELGWDKNFGDLKTIVKIGTKYDSFKSDARLITPGMTLPNSDKNDTVTYAEGFFGIHEAKQRSFYQSTYLKYKGIEDHAITIGYRLSREDTYDVVTKTTDRDSDSGTDLVDYTQTFPFFDVNAQRDTVMFSVQDQMEIGTRLSILYGINIEDTSLSETQYDPRISLVYQSDMQRIYKAIYSRSHRNPSWQELYTINNSARIGNTALNPETVDAFELAMIQKFNGSSYFQADVFYLINKDQIDKDANNTYENSNNTDIYGLELELNTQITPHDELYASYSYVDGSDEKGNDLANVAHHLAKASYIYNFTSAFNAGTVLKYVGNKSRVEGDLRANTPSYVTADVSVSYHNLPHQFNLSFSVKNLADANIAYPSEPNTYVNDYPQDGRTFLFSLSKEF